MCLKHKLPLILSCPAPRGKLESPQGHAECLPPKEFELETCEQKGKVVRWPSAGERATCFLSLGPWSHRAALSWRAGDECSESRAVSDLGGRDHERKSPESWEFPEQQWRAVRPKLWSSFLPKSCKEPSAVYVIVLWETSRNCGFFSTNNWHRLYVSKASCSIICSHGPVRTLFLCCILFHLWLPHYPIQQTLIKCIYLAGTVGCHRLKELWFVSKPPAWPAQCSISFECCVFCGFPHDSDDKESACDAGDLCLLPRSGRSPGEGNGYPL